ncbi:unnamed protein product [Nezara viridula]|uniref:Uncharacterized protein n=1 Tax=Nezara viridula TaxID=85310 RepID=A0A9P0MYP4_NEZVI|nr:unnamed protein product [Nezara viridula]
MVLRWRAQPGSIRSRRGAAQCATMPFCVSSNIKENFFEGKSSIRSCHHRNVLSLVAIAQPLAGDTNPSCISSVIYSCVNAALR